MDMSGVGSDYKFLNDYISRIITGPDADNKVLEDHNDFYDSSESEEEPDNSLSIDNSNDNTDDEGYRLANQFLAEDEEENSSQDESDDQVNNDDQETDIYGSGSTGSVSDITGMTRDEEGYVPDLSYVPADRKTEAILPGNLGSSIAAKESQGKYTAFNPKGGGAGAVGKYQFRWNVWKDSIQKVTGIKDKEQFRHSPAAQEKYYAWYEKHVLAPEVKKLQPYNIKHLSNEQLGKLVHFRGAGGARKYLKGQVADKPESYNESISSYIGKRQAGGMGVAVSPSAQNMGLNHPGFDHMVFPMSGSNVFRGLDDGTPVYLEDETGKKKILKGKKHKTAMTGMVYEKRLK